MRQAFLNLKEAIEKDPALGPSEWKRLCETYGQHPIIRGGINEGLFADVALALGGMQTQVIQAAYPAQISREVLSVVRTTKAAERFYKQKATGYVFDNSGNVMALGPKVTNVDITPNKTYTTKQEWNQDFAEDVSWDITGFYANILGQDIAKKENTDVITLLEAIVAGDLAGGAEMTVTDGAITWAQIVTGIKAMRKVNRAPSVIIGNSDELLNLLNVAEFMSSLYNQAQDWRQGVVYHTQLGIKFITCSLCNKVVWIDPARAGVLLLRQDIMTQPWEDRANFMVGISGRERVGMGILDANAVARGDH